MLISKWILKAIVQKAISYLPFSSKINYFFQKYVTKGVYLNDEYFFDRLGHAQEHLKGFVANFNRIPVSCLELGTGWYPVVPISFFLSGVNEIYSIDITFLTSKERIIQTLESFKKSKENAQLSLFLNVLEERWHVIIDILDNKDRLSIEEIMKKMHLVYLIEDARKISLSDNSIELVNSNNTFEHIYPDILIPILQEFKRIVSKESGILSHFIDMSDHFAHFDKTINIYNFLKFSDKKWAFIDNSIQPQNRLRMDDYEAIYTSINIPISHKSFREGRIHELKTIHIDKKFIDKPLEIIAISHCHFISIYNV